MGHNPNSRREEPTLFMVSASVLSNVSNSDSKSMEVTDGVAASMSVVGEGSIDPKEELQLGETKAPAEELIQLKEERVFAQIGERGEQQEHRRWVLDTGATNHMTRAKSTFSELNSGIRGTVKFGNDFIVEIKGHDTILFVVSLGQLKHGLLKICNDQRRLLT